jgi:dGTPase
MAPAMHLVDRRIQEEWERKTLAPYAMRSSESRGRRYPEADHPLRTCYQRDRDRVIHSSSFRRLEYKTQVFVTHEGDNYRTRLTHSMEAAQIGRTVARALGLNEELTECLTLGHDLGHTPFGHSGEKAMDELMRDHGGFDHNRQTLRILETLEERYPDFPGLNLTWEVREGIAKHRRDNDANAPEEYAPGEPPTLEAQIVDLVDEIAYNNHDIDDGLFSGMFTVEQIRNVTIFRRAHDAALAAGLRSERLIRHRVVRDIINKFTQDLLEATLGRLTEERIESVQDVRQTGQRLVGHSPDAAELIRELKEFLFTHMYRHYRVVRMGGKAGRILRDLFHSYVQQPLQLPPHFQERVGRDGAERAVCDYIAGMTDRFAVEEHRKLFDPRVRV